MLKLYCDYFFCKRTKQGEGGDWDHLLDRDSGCGAGTVPSQPGEEGRILAFCSAHLRLIQEASAPLLPFLLSYSQVYDCMIPPHRSSRNG